MRLTYDAHIDTAYLYFTDEPEPKVEETVVCDHLPANLPGKCFNFDFSDKGVLLGMEIFLASKVLPPEMLKLAEKEDSPWERKSA